MSGSRGDFLVIVSEYDQEIPQSQTTDNPVALRKPGSDPHSDGIVYLM